MQCKETFEDNTDVYTQQGTMVAICLVSQYKKYIAKSQLW